MKSGCLVLQFTCIFSHLIPTFTCKRWKKLHQDMTLNTYQVLFVQLVGGNHMLFHCCFIQRVEESERSEANTWCGSRRWHVARMRYCFFIHLYQELLIDGEMEKDGGKRENMCWYRLWGRWCEKYNLKETQSSWPLQERNTSGNVNFTCSATAGAGHHLNLPPTC